MEKIIKKKFSSKIIISTKEIDKIITDEKKKIGKYEYDFTEVFLKTKIIKDFTDSKKKLRNFISLLGQI